jgi:hypothetical protein
MDNNNRDTIIFAVSLILKAAVVAAKYSGRVRKRSLKRLAAMDIDEKDKEMLFLIDKVYQLNTQISILLKRVEKHQKKPRYTLRERLLILWHMETFQIPRRKIAQHLGVSKSTVYRWLNKIQYDEKEEPKSIPARYPNHVWSIDTTEVMCWGLWPINICIVIDHFSRKVMSVTLLEGPNAGWINNALESAIEKHGAPKHNHLR